MKQKKVKTKEEVNSRKEELRIRRLPGKLATAVKNLAIEKWLRCTELQLEFLKSDTGSKTMLPYPGLTVSETIEAYEAGIRKYKEWLVIK